MKAPAAATTTPGRQALTSAEWRSLERSGKAPEHALLRRFQDATVRQLSDEELQALGDARAAGDGRAFDFVISTATEDRYRDTIRVDGWLTDNFLKGGPGPVLWCHDYWTPPVGKSPSVRAIGPALVARAIFPTRELHPFGHLIGELFAGQFMKAVSVGFDPFEWSYDEERGGYNFLEQDLLEFSAVNVPANPEALIVAQQKGLDLEPLDRWAREALERSAGEAILPVPAAKLKALVKALGYGRGLKFFDLGTEQIRSLVRAKVRGEEAVETDQAVEETEAEPVAGEQVAPAVQADGSDTPPPVELAADAGTDPIVATIEVAGLDELRALVERAEAVAAKLAPAADQPTSVLFRVAPDPPEPTVRISQQAIERAMERAVAERFEPLEKQITAVTGRVF